MKSRQPKNADVRADESRNQKRSNTIRFKTRLTNIPQQYKYIFIYHRLTVVLSLEKGALPRKVTHVLHCHVKLAFLWTVYVFKSGLHRVCSADWRPERETGTRQRIGTNFRCCWMNQLHFLKLTSDTRSGRILPLPTRHSSRAKLLIDHSPPPIRLGRLKPTRSPLIYTWHKAQSYKYTLQTALSYKYTIQTIRSSLTRVDCRCETR